MTIEQRDYTTVFMPALGESIDEGTITRWLKQPGDHVEAKEPLLEVATDKVDTEIPSPVSGTLRRTIAEENDVVTVGAEIAIIVTAPQGSIPSALPPAPGADFRTPTAVSEFAPEHRPSPTPTVLTLKASPNNEPFAAPESTTVKLSRIRRTIAHRMVESLQTSAQLTTVLEVDATAVARLRNAHKTTFLQRTGVNLSFLPFFANATVGALTEHRMLNATLNHDVTEVTYFGACHLGIAVDSEKGLMVPVIRDAQDLSLEGLARAIADKAEKVRAGTISADELSGGTFTITNTGSRGALFDTPIVNQSQSGILGTGAVVDRLVPTRTDGELRIDVRSMAYLSISYDHRIVDGANAARFLVTVKKRIENGFTAEDLA